jgi:Rps23 Pro-64 3,4-dihydroxylase Tpa1-like proline 4-hydroxylase
MENNNFLIEGAYVGNLIDFISENELNDVEEYANNLKQYIESRRESHLECIFTLKNMKEDDFNKYDFIRNVPYNDVEKTVKFMEENKLKSWQKWFMLKKPWEFKQLHGEILEKISLKIVNYLYKNKNYKTNDFDYSGTFTLYENTHFIENHQDGKNENKICTVLIYLNEEHNENDGGELVLNTYSNKKLVIKPTLGTFVALDFTTGLGVEHSVNMVNGDFKRYTYINGYTLKSPVVNLI